MGNCQNGEVRGGECEDDNASDSFPRPKLGLGRCVMTMTHDVRSRHMDTLF